MQQSQVSTDVIVKSMTGLSVTLPEASCKHTRRRVSGTMGVADVHIFEEGCPEPLCDTTTLCSVGKYFAIPRDPQFDQPLIKACRDADILSVTRLIEHNADVNSSSPFFCTALQFATLSNAVDIVSLLIEHGANVNIVNLAGYTALRYACVNRFATLVAILLENGADISDDDVNDTNSTPEILGLLNQYRSMD